MHFDHGLRETRTRNCKFCDASSAQWGTREGEGEEEASGKTESRVMKLCKYANPHFLWMMLFDGKEEPENEMWRPGDLSPLPTYLKEHAFFRKSAVM